MKISEILKKETPSLSFEVFPPKTDSSFDSVRHATEEISALRPAFMSVTYGAGGGTSRYTLEIAKNIKERFGVPTLAHLTCVSSTKETVKEMIENIRNAGISNVMALRGDIPESMINDDRSKWEYLHAVDLVRELKESGADFCIGGACYPEIHPESINQKEDIKYLKEKVEAGCEFLTTQMFFDNNLLYNFLYKIREAGITVPVIAGIMPITNANQVARAIKLSGSFVPQRFKSLVDKFGNNKSWVDDMKLPIEAFINERANQYAKENNLHYCTVASVNPGGIIIGPATAASADGRKCAKPFALANSPMPGTDVSGLTAMLLSAAKANPANGGYVTNINLSRETLINHREKISDLLNAYFKIGGLQLNINCFAKGDLEKALKNPQKYRNLIVRVSGYSARFIDLDETTQKHIMERTLY